MTADGKKVDLGGDKFKGHYKDAAICESLPDTTGNAAAHFKCRVARNKILNQWMALSDRVCEKHLGAVQGNSTLINVGSGFITIVTSTLATFVGAGATPQALSAAAAISSATGTLANEQIYLQQVVPVLTSKIRTNRREIGDRLIANLSKKVALYTVDDGLRELTKYHESCSFAVGLELIAASGLIPRKKKAGIDAELTFLDGRIGEVNTLLTNVDTEITNILAANASADTSEQTTRMRRLQEEQRKYEDQRATLVLERLKAPE